MEQVKEFVIHCAPLLCILKNRSSSDYDQLTCASVQTAWKGSIHRFLWQWFQHRRLFLNEGPHEAEL